MLKVFRFHSWSVFAILALIECLVLMAAVYGGVMASYAGTTDLFHTVTRFAPESFIFSGTLLLTLFSLGLYHWEYCSKFGDVITRMIVAFVAGFIALSTIFYVFPAVEIWRSAAFVAVPLSFAGVLAVRLAFSKIPSQRFFKRRILVIGVGEQAARIEHLETSGKAYRFCCVAFIDVKGDEVLVSKSRVISKVNSLPDFIEREAIDEIVVAVQERRGNLPLDMLVDCRLAGISVVSFQAFFERETDHIELDALQPEWFVFSSGFPGGRLQQLCKRGFDIVMSVLLLIMLSPLMVIAAILIRLEGKGPIIFRQTRVGYRGETFMLLKFRSMRVDAERDGIPRWARTKDPRVTAIGSFLRATRIDELPQLFNILKGDMSLVGPRPERPYFVERLSQVIPYYNVRHRVKPGLAGWAQLYYPYGASDDDAKKKLQYELYYIKYFSVLRDFIIIIQTLRVVIWPNRV